MSLKIISFLFLICLTIFSCKKAVQRDKLLQGSWKLKKVTVFDYDGLSYSTDTSCVGELILNNEIDTSFKFLLNYSIFPSFADSTLSKGRYVLKDDAEYFSHEYLSATNLNPLPGNHSRILFLSDDYFKWEYISSVGIRYHLIFEKK
jgi:hypothetical protein